MKEQLKQEVEKYFQQACEKLGISNALPEVSMLPERNKEAVIAFYKLSVIIQCTNEDWEPNWKDRFEPKYHPWFEVTPAGFGYSHTNSAASAALASIGSRLCYKTRDLAIEWGQKLLPLYEDMLLLK